MTLQHQNFQYRPDETARNVFQVTHVVQPFCDRFRRMGAVRGKVFRRILDLEHRSRSKGLLQKLHSEARMIDRSLSFARLRPLRQHALFLSLQPNTHQYAFGRFSQRNYAIRARVGKLSRRVVNCHVLETSVSPQQRDMEWIAKTSSGN